jgi:hypothetical protein
MTIILFIVIALAAAAAVYFFFFSDYRVNKPVLQNLGIKIPDNVTATDNGLLYKDKNGLVLMDFKGKTVWSLPTDSETKNYISSDSIISTYGQHTAQFFTYEKKQLFTTTLDNKTIVSVRCGTNAVGILATAQDANGQNHSYIYTYDLTGKNVGQIDLSDKQIIDFGIYQGTDMFWALSLDTSGVVPASYIVTFKQNGTNTGIIEVNTQIVEKVNITDDTIYASGTNSLIAYSYFGEKKNDTLIYGWRPYDTSIDGTNIRMIFSTRTTSGDAGTISSVKLMDNSLSEIMIYFPREIFAAMVNQNNVYAFANDTIYIYNVTGKATDTVKLDSPITSAKKVSNNYAVIWNSATSYLYQLR